MNYRIQAIAILLTLSTAFSAEKELRIEHRKGEVLALSKFEEATLDFHYFGRYAFSAERTGGLRLHLFPDGSFVISDWGDIRDEEVVAVGKFKHANGKLSLEYGKIDDKRAEIKARFSSLNLFFGRVEKAGQVSGFDVFLFDDKALQELSTGTSTKHDYLTMDTQYYDWPKILSEFRRNAAP